MENLNNDLKVKTITMSGNFWKWPEKDDIICDMIDLICKVQLEYLAVEVMMFGK